VGQPLVLKITSRDLEPPPPEYISVSGELSLDMTIHDFGLARHVIGSKVPDSCLKWRKTHYPFMASEPWIPATPKPPFGVPKPLVLTGSVIACIKIFRIVLLSFYPAQGLS